MAFLGVYGHVNVDHILHVATLPGADQTVPVEREEVRLGGTAGNIARAAAALGVSTALASCVGSDFPEHLEAQLRASPIDLVDFRRLPGSTPKIWILTSKEGTQSAVIEQGVMGDGQPRPTLDYTLLNSDWVHFTTGSPADHFAAAKEAARVGKKVAFDPAQELGYRYSDRAFEEFCNVADVLFLNHPELRRALDKLGYGDPMQLLDHADAVVVTQGSQGSHLYTDRGATRIPARPVHGGPPRDTTGAGDVFRGGFYAALERRQPLDEAVRWGSVAASLFLEAQGQRFPTMDELRAQREKWRP